MSEHIIVFTGAGISAESGLKTFRDMGGYWHEHRIEDVATPEGFSANPQLVLDFYNQRRREVLAAQPNAAHRAIAALEERFTVSVITQNIDDLHERAGSSRVIHLHGELLKGQSSRDASLVLPLQKPEILPGELAPDGSQMRPHVVWFGEAVLRLDEAAEAFAQADKVLVVGTSLSVFPAAGLLQYTPDDAERVLVALDVQRRPEGFAFWRTNATEAVPRLVGQWLGRAGIPENDGSSPR
ncbi:NAD-dependent deacylase [Corticibacter populi]|uniref:NAD-dependent protein deacylase n=1 Tax=Corticibacter populi TaxID=1550736 RepID=A0A3M6QZ16_9BURK|nr:Sir2 family NAD-dependent protein deacetylase [Corticibacter populi]RMX07762.1 NAD-dependent deacylase [Corticibacter populi]RZS34984.1 NAD-dependent deacetylase [Corticibacter populi]